MMINVTLATNRLQLETFVGGNLYSSVTYINIVAVSDGKDVNRLVTAPTPSGAPTTTTTQDDFIVRLHLADQLHVDLPLKYIANQAGWTNDQAGYEQAEADIYAAFPAGGGGGGGTVTSVGMTVPAFLSVAGSPIVGAGTLAVSLSGTALPLANGGTGATTPVLARANLHAADFYPTFTFSTTTTTNVDPGAGFFRFNNAVIGSVSEFSISNTAHFEGGDQDVGLWMYGWAGQLVLKNIANDDIIIISLYQQLNNTPYLRMSTGFAVNTIIGGVANAQPVNNSVWRFVSVGDYIINANVQFGLSEKVNANTLPLRYKWIGDGGAAIGTVVANTLGETINVTNPATGRYEFTAASGTPFTSGKTTITVQPLGAGTAYFADAANPNTSTTVQNVYIFDALGLPSDTPRYQVIIEVEP